MRTGTNVQSGRPVVRVRSPMRMAKPRRRWDQASWWFSVLFVIPVILIAADRLLGYSPGNDDARLTVRVFDQSTNSRIQGATVAIGAEIQQTDKIGEAKFKRLDRNTLAQIGAPGYAAMYGLIETAFGRTQVVGLRPLTIAAGQTGQTPDQTAAPSTQVLTQEPDVADAATEPVNAANSESIASGAILDENGGPINQALVRAGSAFTRTNKSGMFSLENADFTYGIAVTAPGYARQDIAAGTDLSVRMVRQNIKALFLNGTVAGDDAAVDHMTELIDTTEINAVVIDIKENVVFYDTKVQFFRDADAVDPTYDPAALLQKFKDRGIYTIARLVVFNDPKVAEANHDLAVQDEVSGDVWRGYDGGAWVNPFKQELWQPNIDLAVEAAGFGFDEIQYDYIRFPSDGDLTTADFGPDYSEEGRVAAIVDFLKASRNALAPTGAMLAVDMFGIVAVYPDDQGIGQRFADIAKVVDYVCPMIYPSHFGATSIDVGGEPNELPYETIELSVYLALQKMPNMELKLRPWLQDFPWGDQPYDAEEVRAQITAVEDQAGSGWILWNAGSEFTEDALNPE